MNKDSTETDLRQTERLFAKTGGAIGGIAAWYFFAYVVNFPPFLAGSCSVIVGVLVALLGQIIGTIYHGITEDRLEEDVSKSEP